jgi:acyl-CoA synthetase (NDP forming)
VTGPVEVTAEIPADDFRQVVELLADDADVDAIIALMLPTGATGDLVTAVEQAQISVPVAAVVLDQPEWVRLLDGRVPAYADPETAVAAIARAAGYGAWRREPRGVVPEPDSIKADRAHDIVRRFLRQHTGGGGWLASAETTDTLSCYGITFWGVQTNPPDVVVRITDDHVFGPLVAVDRDGEQTARFAPLTDMDADALTESARGGPALRELLLRLSRLADDLPEVSELELTPTGARIRVAPYVAQDPFLRRLR